MKKAGRKKEENRYRISGRLDAETHPLWNRLENRNGWIKRKLKDEFFQYNSLTKEELVRILRERRRKLAQQLELQRERLQEEYLARIEALGLEIQKLETEGNNANGRTA